MAKRGGKGSGGSYARQAEGRAPGIIRGTIRPSSQKVTRTWVVLDEDARCELKALRRTYALGDADIFYLLYEHDLAALITPEERSRAAMSDKYVVGGLALLEAVAIATQVPVAIGFFAALLVVACVLLATGRLGVYASELRRVRKRLRGMADQGGAEAVRGLLGRAAPRDE